MGLLSQRVGTLFWPLIHTAKLLSNACFSLTIFRRLFSQLRCFYFWRGEETYGPGMASIWWQSGLSCSLERRPLEKALLMPWSTSHHRTLGEQGGTNRTSDRGRGSLGRNISVCLFVRVKSRKLTSDLSCIIQNACFCCIKTFSYREPPGQLSPGHM